MKNNFKAFFISEGKNLFIFSIISGILILSWFRDGLIYGGGDVGLQTYNPKRILENASYVWWDSTAPGSPIPQGLSAVPFQFFLFLLQTIGFSPLLLQSTLFLILLFLMGFGMYLFLEQKLQDRKIYSILGGLFYMFNPYMMVQVWHRFIHTTIILAASLPFFALLWDKWIKKGSLKSLLFFLLSNFLAVYIFGTFAFIVTVWIFLLFITVSNLIPWNKAESLKIGGRFLFGLVVWGLINFWHLYPVTQISPAVLSEQHKSSESIVTLVDISAQAILPYTLQLANPFYLFHQAEFGAIYKNNLFQIFPWIFVAAILIGLLNSFKIKQLSLYGILFLISIFLVKGAAPPFGNLYLFGFKNIFALGVLRNPFEKTGLILVFFATILFVLGLKVILEKNAKNSSLNKFLIILIIISIFIFSWPMFAGKLIGRIDHPAYVRVPQSYSQADDWLNKQKNSGILDGKILHLPLTRQEAVSYNWQFGYNGLEPSDTFFTAYPSISRGFNIQRVDDSLTALSLVFHKPYYEDSEKILQLLQAFNVRFLVLHKDLNFLGQDTYDPNEAEKVLDSLSFIEKKAQFGDLVIYQVADKFFGPKIEIRENVSLVYPQKVNMRVWPWLISQGYEFISPAKSHDLDENIKSHIKENIIFPENSFSYPEASGSSLPEMIKGLGTKLSGMRGTVAYLKQLGTIQTQTEETVNKIILASQKLIQVYQGASADEYSLLIDDIFPSFKSDSFLYYDIAKKDVLDVLKIHEILKPGGKIREILKNENLLPIFPFMDKITEVGQRQLYNFWVSKDGKYELFLGDSKIKDAYVDKLAKLNFQINDKLQTLSGKDIGNAMFFGNIDLITGINEISFSNPVSVNLIPSYTDLVKIGSVAIQGDTVQMIVSRSSPAAIETATFSTTGEDIFQISLDGQIPAKVGFYIQVIQDTDTEENGQKLPRISFLQHIDQTDWQGSFSLKLPALSLQTRQAKIRLVGLIPPEVPVLDNTQFTIQLKNLRVVRVLNNNLFLKDASLNTEVADVNPAQVTFERISPVEYKGEINLTKIGFIFFKETYHPGWKLQLINGDNIVEPKQHYLGDLYGNAWFIEQPGTYKFKITFEPQKSLSTGILISSLGLFSILFYIAMARKLHK